MLRLPVLRASELIRALEKAGFQVVRQKGSHVRMKHPDGRVVIVPVHSGQDIGRGRAIAFIMSGRLWDTEKPFLLPLDCQIQWLGPGSGDPGRANGINAIALSL